MPLTADIEINSTNDFSRSEIEKIESVIIQPDIVEARNAMTHPVDGANESLSFVELKGIEAPFPLVGASTLSDGGAFDFKLLENRGAGLKSSKIVTPPKI